MTRPRCSPLAVTPRLIEGRSCSQCGAALYIDSPTDDCGHCATCWEFHHDCRCPKAA